MKTQLFRDRSETPGNRILGNIKQGMVLASLLLWAETSSAAVDATLSSATISSTSTIPISLQVTGLPVSASVTIERIPDANGNGTVDADELAAEIFTVTDGLVSSIGGIRNVNIPGDEDLAVDGQINIDILPSTGPELGRLSGQQLIRISSPTSAFVSFMKTLTITQPAEGQFIQGTVTDGTDPLPFAAVILLDATTDGEFIGGVVADGAGQFSVNAPVGSYQLAALKSGYVGDFGSAPVVNLGAGGSPTQNVEASLATTSISGTITDSSSSAGLGGIQLFISSDTGAAAVTSTAADGTYSVPVTSGTWGIEISEISASKLGYLSIQANSNATADTTGGAATGIDATLTKGTALVYGTVSDPSSNPLPGVEVNSNDEANIHSSRGVTDTFGNYVIAVSADNWSIFISSSNPSLAGYVIPGGQSVSLPAGEVIQVDFSLSAVNAHIQGVVTNMGAPVSGITIGASNQSGFQFITTVTGNDGSFDLGLLAGTWNVQLESESAASFNVVGSSVEVTLVENETVSGINFAVLSSTTTISGTLKDSAMQAVNGNVYATATIATVDYSTNTSSDSGGNYSLPVIDGSWTVGANANGFDNPSNVVRLVSGSNETVNFTFLTNIEKWRETNFSNTADSGNGADLFDFDYDGIPNLVEYALGLNPKSGSASQLPKATRTGNNLVISLTEPGGVSGITYGSEWSTTLKNGSWTPISDSGSPPMHLFSVPFGSNTKLFMRLKITRP